MSGLWDQRGVPHAGWRCAGITDLGEATHVCEMCGQENIRYVHDMTHDDFDRELQVGCVCAEKMENDYTGAVRKREAPLRNRTSRRAKWCARQWLSSSSGGVRLKSNGAIFSVSPSRFGPGFYASVLPSDSDDWIKAGTFATIDAAKLAIFDKIWPEKIRF